MSDSVDQNTAAAGISLHELKLINIGLHCVKGKAGTDIDKFTKMAGYKSNSVASTTWSRVKRHLQKVVPVVEPEESDDVGEPKDGTKKRKRAAKKVEHGSGDESGPSKKQSRGKKVQKDEPSDETANEPIIKKARIKKVAEGDDINEEGAMEKTALQSAAKNGATPDNDDPPALECITVKSSDDEPGPSTKKGDKVSQKGKAGAVKGMVKAEASKEDFSDEYVLATKADKKGVSAKKGKGKGSQGSDASDNDFGDGKTNDAAKAGKNNSVPN